MRRKRCERRHSLEGVTRLRFARPPFPFGVAALARADDASSWREIETKYEFEFTPSQFIQIEFGALGSTHNIGGVTDLDDRRQVALGGAFAELRYLAIERTSNNPLSVTLAVEPTLRRIDETSGERVRNFEFETTVNADLELLKNRLYAGFNLLYEPEVTQMLTGETQ